MSCGLTGLKTSDEEKRCGIRCRFMRERKLNNKNTIKKRRSLRLRGSAPQLQFHITNESLDFLCNNNHIKCPDSADGAAAASFFCINVELKPLYVTAVRVTAFNLQ